ncbi:MAG: acyl-CoA dehydrogenase family protein [Ilumatobacteraceae bacterium]
MNRTLFAEEHDLFRVAFRRFVEREVQPHVERWEDEGICDRELFAAAGRSGFLGVAAPADVGGGATADFRFSQIMLEEFERVGAGTVGSGVGLHNDVALPYLLRYATPEQAARWLPSICAGELILGIAMSEPGVGSDLAALATRASRDGDVYVVNGAKTFISNGINGDLFVTAVRTGEDPGHAGISLLVVERGTSGFTRGRNLAKVGRHAQDTAELFFDDARVPVANRLGEEGRGFRYMMSNLPQERLNIAISALGAAQRAFELSLDYGRQRHAFGQPVASFQHSRFTLAEMATELAIAQSYVDSCVTAHNSGDLSPSDAAMAKWWVTELATRVADRGLQLHGGFGYMDEAPISRAWRDSRVLTIYGGTTEIMKEIIGRELVGA